MPAVASARTADSRPEPGPLTRTSTDLSPLSPALLAAVMAACCAANGVPLRDPRKPSEPALDHEITLPSWSAMVTMVLLNVACMCTMPEWTTRFSFFLKLFFLVGFAGAFAIRLCYVPLCFRCGFLLIGHGAAPRTLAGARVGVSALAAHGQAAPVPQAAVGAHLDVALDVHRDFLAQVALDGAFLFQNLADPIDFVLGQIGHLFIEIDARAVQQRARTGASDAIDVGEPDFRPLFGRHFHSGDTSHNLSLPLFMFRVGADHPDHAFAVDNLALIANLFD